MNLDSSLLGNLGIAVPNAMPENKDGTLSIPPILLHALDPIFPLYKISGVGATSETSQIIAVQVIRNNQGAGSNTIITFSRGLYEVDLSLTTRFNWTAVGTTPHTEVRLFVPGLSSSNPVLSCFAATGIQQVGRKFKMLIPIDGWSLTLNYGVTAVAENLEASVSAVVTKIL